MEARTVLYKEFLAERQEILRHKWIESEKAGYDIGFEHALFDWTLKYRAAWLEKRLPRMAEHESPRTTKLHAGTKDEITSSERSESGGDFTR
jgi:hypothetical protein